MDGNDLISYFQNGLKAISPVGPIVGAIFTAIFYRKKVRDAEFEKLKAKKFQEVADQLLASGYMTYTEYYKANNFLHIAELADKVYNNDYENQSNQNQKYDFDWFMRFYDIVGNISDGEMQALWARILAGELHQKGTYSLQLLDILKNFTQKQAELVNRVCSHCFMSEDKAFIPNDQEYSKFVGITYQDILDLDGLGLMNSSGIISLSANVKPDRPFALINNQLRMVVKCSGQENTEKEFNFSQFPFTSAGRELIKLLGKRGSDQDFLFFIKLLIKKNSIGGSFIITADKIVIKDNTIQFERINLDD
jgi:hypothetical protein